MRKKISSSYLVVIAAVLVGTLSNCATTPRADRQSGLVEEARWTTSWFERSVVGLSDQINSSGGFVVFPDVAKWGILISGGQAGRGVVCTADGTQVGWAMINTGSIGLQAGVQGFRLLAVLQDADQLERLKNRQLTGSVSASVVAGDAGAAAAAPFDSGVAVYQGANEGLFVGVNIGLDYIRYEALAPGDPVSDLR